MTTTNYPQISTGIDTHMDDKNLWTGDAEADKRLWQEEAYNRLNNLRETDPEVGQFIMMINAADEDNRLRGAGHFLWAMSEGFGFRRALNGACKAAGLEAPAEDLGPLDSLLDAADERRENRHDRPRPQNNGTGGRLARIRTALTRRV